MPSSKPKTLTRPYACIQALYWMYFAAIMSFSGSFLLDGGFSNTQIGIIAAAAGIFLHFFSLYSPAMLTVRTALLSKNLSRFFI